MTKHDKTCPRCSGGGEVMASTVHWAQRCEGQFAVCPDCRGTGHVEIKETTR